MHKRERRNVTQKHINIKVDEDLKNGHAKHTVE
jgi:hypothetical protein